MVVVVLVVVEVGEAGQRIALCSAPQLIPIWRNPPNVGDRLALRRGLVK